MLKRGKTKTKYPSIPVSVSMCLCGRLPVRACVCVCVHLCVAVQKMAEAHMQNLGVYPPLEDPCEGEEDEDNWQREEGEDTSPTKAAGERSALCQLAGTTTAATLHTVAQQQGQHCCCCFLKENTLKALKHCKKQNPYTYKILKIRENGYTSNETDNPLSEIMQWTSQAGDICSVRVSKGVFFLQVCVNTHPFPLYSS